MYFRLSKISVKFGKIGSVHGGMGCTLPLEFWPISGKLKIKIHENFYIVKARLKKSGGYENPETFKWQICVIGV